MRLIDADELRREFIIGHDLVGAKYVDLAPTIEPNLVINPEEVAEGRVIEIGEDIIVMHHKDYYDLLCEQLKMEFCEDAISRESVITAIGERVKKLQADRDKGATSRAIDLGGIIPLINDIPSVAPSGPSGENIGTDYAECDQFICSECGIHLQGWVRIDEDDYDDGIVHEYEFRFCPNCGARMKTEEDILREQCRALIDIVKHTERSE